MAKQPSSPIPVPLFPSQEELKHISNNSYPELYSFLGAQDEHNQSAWSWAKAYLLYVARTKSDHTYTRFRSEIEKFLLWAFLIKKKDITSFRKADILDFADFCWKPPVDWICLANYEKFVFSDGAFKPNPEWAPFRYTPPKHNSGDREIDKSKYRPSQQSIQAMFTAVIAFYKYLMDEEYTFGNPAQIAKKDCRYIIKDAQVKEVRRLSNDQWEFLLDTAHRMADEDEKHERTLFLIAALKTLFLRISELSERKDWIPMMSHFWMDQDKNWWLKIYGKGRKLRDITVPPAFLDYLRRYREQRGLSPLPYEREQEPIIEKLRGRGGMTSRQLSRIVQEVFDRAGADISQKHGPENAQKFREATTHWLRHTGASLEVERGRALKDLSEDLGHASMATTDTVYVQTEDKKRAESGKSREV